MADPGGRLASRRCKKGILAPTSPAQAQAAVDLGPHAPPWGEGTVGVTRSLCADRPRPAGLGQGRRHDPAERRHEADMPPLQPSGPAGPKAAHSTVTDLARLRGWSTSVPLCSAVW